MKMKYFAFLLLSVFSATFSCQTSDPETEKAHDGPKNIILMVGDGMGTSQVYAGLVGNKGHLNLERSQFIGFQKTPSADKFTTDSGAGATAFSIGKKANNGGIGVDGNNEAHPTILEIADQNGLATGIVATCALTHATPASFIAHQPSREMGEEIAADFLKTDIDVFIGGGRDHFSKRKDGGNLLDSLEKRGYQVVHSIEEVGKVQSGKLAAFLADGNQARFSEGRGDELSKSVKTALDILSKNEKGFFLLAEGSQIDWGGHANKTDYIVEEMIDFDKVIGEVFDFAEKDGNTLVIITGDHETGGFAISNGNMETGEIEGNFTTTGHTGVMIPVFAFGKGAEAFSGIYENTDIFNKMREAYGF